MVTVIFVNKQNKNWIHQWCISSTANEPTGTFIDPVQKTWFGGCWGTYKWRIARSVFDSLIDSRSRFPWKMPSRADTKIGLLAKIKYLLFIFPDQLLWLVLLPGALTQLCSLTFSWVFFGQIIDRCNQCDANAVVLISDQDGGIRMESTGHLPRLSSKRPDTANWHLEQNPNKINSTIPISLEWSWFRVNELHASSLENSSSNPECDGGYSPLMIYNTKLKSDASLV